MEFLIFDFLIQLLRKLYGWIPGGMIAGGIGFTSFCILSLIFVFPRINDTGGMEYPFWMFVCAFLPLVVFLGAFGSFFATRLVMQMDPEIPQDRIARLTGALIGCLAGIAAAIIFLYLMSEPISP